MKITSISVQQKDKNRVNVSVDGVYRFSLDVFQVGELGLRIGREYSEEEFAALEQESRFGKLYARTLEYCLLRPHSAKEVRDYLYKKTLTRRVKHKKTGEIKEKKGVGRDVAFRVFDRLVEKGYVDDEAFTRYWVEHRNQRKGVSFRKLRAELQSKGVESSIIETALSDTERSEEDELRKVIAAKQSRYKDANKLVQYLARQGFSYALIMQVLAEGQ
jgi:regulatory protein